MLQVNKRLTQPTPQYTNMKCFVLLAAAFAVAGAGVAPLHTLVRAPAYDSAFIKSERVGGNFAYKTIESHAYVLHTPLLQQQQLAIPFSVAYSAAPAFTYAAPAVIAETSAKNTAPVEEIPAVEEEIAAVPAAEEAEKMAVEVPAAVEEAVELLEEAQPTADVPESPATDAPESNEAVEV